MPTGYYKMVLSKYLASGHTAEGMEGGVTELLGEWSSLKALSGGCGRDVLRTGLGVAQHK